MPETSTAAVERRTDLLIRVGELNRTVSVTSFGSVEVMFLIAPDTPFAIVATDEDVETSVVVDDKAEHVGALVTANDRILVHVDGAIVASGENQIDIRHLI